MKQRRVVCAAIQNEHGDVICGVRHYDQHMHAQIGGKSRNSRWYGSKVVQGFVDNKFQFLTREEAWNVALKADQIKQIVGGNGTGKLYSENLY